MEAVVHSTRQRKERLRKQRNHYAAEEKASFRNAVSDVCREAAAEDDLSLIEGVFLAGTVPATLRGWAAGRA